MADSDTGQVVLGNSLTTLLAFLSTVLAFMDQGHRRQVLGAGVVITVEGFEIFVICDSLELKRIGLGSMPDVMSLRTSDHEW